MSEDTLDKITSLIEAEANEDLVFPVQNENRNPNERVMEGLYQKKQTNSIGMFKRQHNFAFPSNGLAFFTVRNSGQTCGK